MEKHCGGSLVRSPHVSFGFWVCVGGVGSSNLAYTAHFLKVGCCFHADVTSFPITLEVACVFSRQASKRDEHISHECSLVLMAWGEFGNHGSCVGINVQPLSSVATEGRYVSSFGISLDTGSWEITSLRNSNFLFKRCRMYFGSSARIAIVAWWTLQTRDCPT